MRADASRRGNGADARPSGERATLFVGDGVLRTARPPHPRLTRLQEYDSGLEAGPELGAPFTTERLARQRAAAKQRLGEQTAFFGGAMLAAAVRRVGNDV